MFFLRLIKCIIQVFSFLNENTNHTIYTKNRQIIVCKLEHTYYVQTKHIASKTWKIQRNIIYETHL